MGNKGQDIEEDQKDSVSKSSDNESIRDMLPRHTSQNGFLESELSSFLREIRFSKQEFPAGTPVSDIKYDYPGSQNNNSFYPFNDQLDYVLAHYFIESETTKGNIDRFLSDPLISLLMKKLFYGNADK